jgi:hypothetical protein
VRLALAQQYGRRSRLGDTAVVAAAFHNAVIAPTLAGAAARFAVNRDPDRAAPSTSIHPNTPS